MDTSSYLKAQARIPFRRYFLPRNSSKENLDRFIPNRSAMDFDYAHFALTEGREAKEEEVSPSREAYRKQLAEALNLNRTRILAFRNKPSTSVPKDHSASSSSLHYQRFQPLRPPRRIPQGSERTLDAPGFMDDIYLNILDWSSSNVVAVALDKSVCLWDASTGSVTELVRYGEDKGPVTSVNWAHDGVNLGVGLKNGEVDIWDCETKSLMRTLGGCHHEPVGSLAWNSHILTSGGMDGRIFNRDVRIRSSVVATYKGHTGEVCGLKWSGSGERLASGGRDNLVHIWDRSSSTQWLHRLRGHTSGVKALGWCPFQTHLLASGGGEEDGKIKFWNTQTGACLNSVDTGSQVSCLLWSNKERELLSSRGSQLTLWKYPSMVKMAELSGHESSVVSMSQSPDGCTVVSAAGDERLMFWNVFGVPGTAQKPVPKGSHEPFSHVARSIR
ncbi:hypothetical protein Rs2_02983 [Raphanus sativus]|uniref:Cell division cycle 20.1, cofactor of APC complex-like n=1 Tax=Raphanus sativus TaxID=3726 RepID=A0A9W3BW11_RAPSA|nr:cell division cycle 20.1, cofactor of APC complex-like [Raphanus sativus]KAJ4917433.1 hypothetical protein Rs2_02983 [Raphanus sativus]